jgi:hypothetical protein
MPGATGDETQPSSLWQQHSDCPRANLRPRHRIDRNRFDIGSALGIQEPQQLALTSIFSTPSANHEEYRQKVAPRLGQDVLVTWRAFRVLPLLTAYQYQPPAGIYVAGNSPGKHS